MAVRETLEFDLRAALGQIGTLEKEINDLRKPVKIPIDVTGDAVQDIRSIDDRLEDIEKGVSEVNLELSAMESAVGQSVGDFSRLAQEMGIAEGQAADLAGEILESRTSSLRVAEAAKEVARQMGLSEDEARRFADEISKAAGKVDQLDTAAGKASGGGLAKLGAGLKNLLVSAAAFIGVREIFSFFNSSVQAFSNLEESTSKANVVFGDFADTVFDFTRNAPEELGSTSAAAIEAASSVGNLFLSIGFGQQAAADMSVAIVQLGTDLASFNNITVDEALEKLRSGLVGEAEPLRTLGVLLSEAAVNAKGLELGLGGVTGKLSEAEKVQARFAIIMEQTATAQGDFARTADGVANTQRTVAASFEELKTQIGGAILPLFKTLIEAVPPLIDEFEDMVPAVQSLAQSIADIATIGGPAIGFLLRLDAELLQFGAILAEVLGTDIADIGSVPSLVQFSRILRGVREAIAAGAPPARVFNDALTVMTQKAEVTAQALNDLGQESRATAQEQVEALRNLLANPPENTTATELIVLRDALTDLEEELRGASEANRDYQFIAATLAQSTDESSQALQSQATILFLLRSEADLLGISFAELIAGGAEKFPELAGLIGTLEPATLGLATAQANLNTFAAAFETTNVRISDAIDEFGLIPAALEISKKKFLANLQVSAAEEAEFQADLLKLFDIAPALATKLQGDIRNRELVKEFLADTFSAARAEDVITGAAEDIFGEFTDAVKTQIEGSDLDQAGIDALTLFLEGFGTTAVAEAGVQALGALIQSEIDKLKFVVRSGQFSFEAGIAPGVIPGGPVSGGGGTLAGGVVITQNIINPTTTDLPTNVAQANQSLAAVGNLFNRAS